MRRTPIMLATAVLAVLALLTGCVPVGEPNPQADRRPVPGLASGMATLPGGRKITMNWYCSQPYRAKWKITRRDGSVASGVNAENPGGYNNSGEPIAGGAFSHDISLGDVELIFTVTIVMSDKNATGWVKITDGPKERAGDPAAELAFEPADRGTRQATVNYHYKPKP